MTTMMMPTIEVVGRLSAEEELSAPVQDDASKDEHGSTASVSSTDEETDDASSTEDVASDVKIREAPGFQPDEISGKNEVKGYGSKQSTDISMNSEEGVEVESYAAVTEDLVDSDIVGRNIAETVKFKDKKDKKKSFHLFAKKVKRKPKGSDKHSVLRNVAPQISLVGNDKDAQTKIEEKTRMSLVETALGASLLGQEATKDTSFEDKAAKAIGLGQAPHSNRDLSETNNSEIVFAMATGGASSSQDAGVEVPVATFLDSNAQSKKLDLRGGQGKHKKLQRSRNSFGLFKKRDVKKFSIERKTLLDQRHTLSTGDDTQLKPEGRNLGSFANDMPTSMADESSRNREPASVEIELQERARPLREQMGMTRTRSRLSSILVGLSAKSLMKSRSSPSSMPGTDLLFEGHESDLPPPGVNEKSTNTTLVFSVEDGRLIEKERANETFTIDYFASKNEESGVDWNTNGGINDEDDDQGLSVSDGESGREKLLSSTINQDKKLHRRAYYRRKYRNQRDESADEYTYDFSEATMPSIFDRINNLTFCAGTGMGKQVCDNAIDDLGACANGKGCGDTDSLDATYVDELESYFSDADECNPDEESLSVSNGGSAVALDLYLTDSDNSIAASEDEEDGHGCESERLKAQETIKCHDYVSGWGCFHNRAASLHRPVTMDGYDDQDRHVSENDSVPLQRDESYLDNEVEVGARNFHENVLVSNNSRTKLILLGDYHGNDVNFIVFQEEDDRGVASLSLEKASSMKALSDRTARVDVAYENDLDSEFSNETDNSDCDAASSDEEDSLFASLEQTDLQDGDSYSAINLFENPRASPETTDELDLLLGS